MPAALQRTWIVSRFACLGERCVDTCCRNWSMQVDEATLARYRAESPELLGAVEYDETAKTSVMRRGADGYCVRLQAGQCSVHASKGETFLGDACHFYPRVTRALGERNVIMTATPSCPEIARLILEEAQPLVHEPAMADRLPQSLTSYLPEGLSPDQALAVHQAFLDAAGDTEASAERIHARIRTVSASLDLIDPKDWPGAAPFYLRSAEMRLVDPNPVTEDPFNLLLALVGLIVASKRPMSERLALTVAQMEQALSVSIDRATLQIHTTEESLRALGTMRRAWSLHAPRHADHLRRWLAAQLSINLYPFAGLGGSLAEKATLIGVRLATFKLGLMAVCAAQGEGPLPQDEVVRVMQSLSRFLDHLGDPAFSLQIYGETGWTDEARMRGLLEFPPPLAGEGQGGGEFCL